MQIVQIFLLNKEIVFCGGYLFIFNTLRISNCLGSSYFL